MSGFIDKYLATRDAILTFRGIALAPTIGADSAFHHAAGIRRLEMDAAGAALLAVRHVLVSRLLLAEFGPQYAGARRRLRSDTCGHHELHAPEHPAARDIAILPVIRHERLHEAARAPRS